MTPQDSSQRVMKFRDQIRSKIFCSTIQHPFHSRYMYMLADIPPFTSPLVHTADMDKVVNIVTTADNTMMTVDQAIPAWPATHVSRKYNITPQMLRRHRSMTPFSHPNLGATFTFLSFLIWMPISSLPTSPFSTSSTLWCSSYKDGQRVTLYQIIN